MSIAGPLSVERADESDGVDSHGGQRERGGDCYDQEVVSRLDIYRGSPFTPITAKGNGRALPRLNARANGRNGPPMR
jgi:hypothetical protein